MRIGIDLDGVLYDFGNAVRKYLDSIGRTYGWKNNGEEPHDWNFFEYWGMTREQFKAICDAGVDAGYIFRGDIRPNAVEALRIIRDLGHEIVIVTDRQFGSHPLMSHIATEDWLDEHNIPFDELWFDSDKTVTRTDMFVEDKRENYDALVANGTDCYLINRDWNLEDDDRQRIDDIIEFAWAVQAKTKSLVL